MSENGQQPAGDSYEGNRGDDPLGDIAAAYSFDDEGVEVFSLSKLIPLKQKIEIAGEIYEFDGELMLDNLLSFVRYEEIRNKQGRGEEVPTEELVAALADTRDRIRDLIAEQNPGREVPEKLRIGPGGISLLVTHLMGGRTALEATVMGLQGGGLAGMEEQLAKLRELVENAAPEDEEEALPEGEQILNPLVSEKSSSAPLSASQTATTGHKTGGRKRRGAASKRTSQRRAKK